MTIGTTNVSFSAIASEFSLANTNLSLQDLGKKQIILNPGNSRQTYTLTDYSGNNHVQNFTEVSGGIARHRRGQQQRVVKTARPSQC